jgi:hypothetical protein
MSLEYEPGVPPGCAGLRKVRKADATFLGQLKVHLATLRTT